MKYTPKEVMIPKYGIQKVINVTVLSPHKHYSAIKPELYLVQLHTDLGSRFYGFEGAEIDSSLRCRVWGFDPKFEEVMAWQDVKEIDVMVDGHVIQGKIIHFSPQLATIEYWYQGFKEILNESVTLVRTRRVVYA